MAIEKRSDLETAIANWMDRADLTARIPEFITLLEARLNRTLRCGEAVVRVQAQTDRQFTVLPEDFFEAISFEVVSSNPTQPLVYMDPHKLNEYQRLSVPSTPMNYSIVGRKLELAPLPSSLVTIEMLYYRKAALPATANATNWLLEVAPDVYLYGALDQASAFLKNDPRASMWKARFEEGVTELMVHDERQRMSGSRLNRGQSLAEPNRV